MALVGALSAFRLTVLLRRGSARRRGHRHGAALFTSRARHGLGARFREGFVVMTRTTAVFVPTSGWHSLGLEIALELLVRRVRLFDLEIDAEPSAIVDSDLVELAQRHGGLVLGPDWSWLLPGRALIATSEGHVIMYARPSAADIARWSMLPPGSPAAERRVRRRVLSFGGVAVALLAGGGVLTWRVTGNADFLIAGVFFAGMVATAVAAGLLLARRLRSR